MSKKQSKEKTTNTRKANTRKATEMEDIEEFSSPTVQEKQEKQEEEEDIEEFSSPEPSHDSIEEFTQSQNSQHTTLRQQTLPNMLRPVRRPEAAERPSEPEFHRSEAAERPSEPEVHRPEDVSVEENDAPSPPNAEGAPEQDSPVTPSVGDYDHLYQIPVDTALDPARDDTQNQAAQSQQDPEPVAERAYTGFVNLPNSGVTTVPDTDAARLLEVGVSQSHNQSPAGLIRSDYHRAMDQHEERSQNELSQTETSQVATAGSRSDSETVVAPVPSGQRSHEAPPAPSEHDQSEIEQPEEEESVNPSQEESDSEEALARKKKLDDSLIAMIVENARQIKEDRERQRQKSQKESDAVSNNENNDHACVPEPVTSPKRSKIDLSEQPNQPPVILPATQSQSDYIPATQSKIPATPSPVPTPVDDDYVPATQYRIPASPELQQPPVSRSQVVKSPDNSVQTPNSSPSSPENPMSLSSL